MKFFKLGNKYLNANHVVSIQIDESAGRRICALLSSGKIVIGEFGDDYSAKEKLEDIIQYING